MEVMGYSYLVKMNLNLNSSNSKNDMNPLLVLHFPGSSTLRVMWRSLVVVMLLFSLPSIVSLLPGSSEHVKDESNLGYLVEDGILKKGDEGLVVSASGAENGKDFDILNQNGIGFRFLSESNLMNIPNESLDFVFGKNLESVIGVDRGLKLGGVVVFELENKKQVMLQPPQNYVVVVYMRPLEHTMVVLRKISHSLSSMASTNGSEKKSPGRRSLCGVNNDAKKEALLGLEDAMLEPPRERNKVSRKMKFLPDLLQDSLEKYPRRIFFSDGDKGVKEWFKKNYPSKGQVFEMYDMEVVANEGGDRKSLSDWLMKNVKEEDYVVMKAEAGLAEEMIKEKSTYLVDELFLECKNQWGDEEEDGENEDSVERSYWQCLALYGRLRDEGVAVHQWWN